MQIKFTMDKQTKNMVRFQAEANAVVAGALYIKKGTALGRAQTITVNVQVDPPVVSDPPGFQLASMDYTDHPF